MGKNKNFGSSGSQMNPFSGFSPFASTLSNALDPEYYQIDPDFQVVLKKLQKPNSISKLKAIEELEDLIEKKIPLTDDKDFDSTSIKALLHSWEFIYRRLVNDDDRMVRIRSSELLLKLGSKVGKYLGPHVKSLIGSWIFAICDQRDEQTQNNTALRAFEKIFPEKKRQDVLRFAIEDAISHQVENLSETLESVTIIGKTPEESQERFDRTISNSLLALEYLLSNYTTPDNGQSQLDKLFEPVLQDKFFIFFNSKSPLIRKTCYRVLSTIIKNLPNYIEKNFKDFSNKVLGIFSEKDPSTHLFMWDAVISFCQIYKERPWLQIDYKKNPVQIKFFKLLSQAFYGSFEVSYPSLVVFLSLLPNFIVNNLNQPNNSSNNNNDSLDNIEFFKLFFNNFLNGSAFIESNTTTVTSNYQTKPNYYFLQSFLECIVYSLKKWKSIDLDKYLIDILLYQLIKSYFIPSEKQQIQFSGQGFLKLISENLQRLSNNPEIREKLKPLFNQILLLDFIDQINQYSNDNATLFNNISQFLENSTEDLLELQFPLYRDLFNHLNQLLKKQHKDKDQVTNLTNGISILFKYYSTDRLTGGQNENQSEDSTEFFENLLESLKSSLIDNNQTSLFNYYQILKKFLGTKESEVFKKYFSQVLELFRITSQQVFNYYNNLSTLVQVLSSDSQFIHRELLVNQFFDVVCELVISTNQLDKLLVNQLLKHLLLPNVSLISNQTIKLILNALLSSLQLNFDICKNQKNVKISNDFENLSVLLIQDLSYQDHENLINSLILKWVEILIFHQKNNPHLAIENLLFPNLSNSNSNSNIFKDFNIELKQSIIKLIIQSISTDNQVYLLELIKPVLNIDTLKYLLNQFIVDDKIIQSTTKSIQLNWYKYSLIIPNHLYGQVDIENTSQIEQSKLIMSFVFHVIQNFDREYEFITTLNDTSISLLLFGHVILNDTDSNDIKDSRLLPSLFKFTDSPIESKWFIDIQSNKNILTSSVNLIIQYEIIKFLSNNQDSFSNLIEKLLSNDKLDKLLLLPLVTKEKLESLKSDIITRFNTIVTNNNNNIPNSFESLSNDIILLCNIIKIENEMEYFENIPVLNQEQLNITLLFIQTLQMWYGRIHNIIKDQVLQDFIKQIELPLIQFFNLILPLISKNSIYLSQNQSQIIQSLLTTFLSPNLVSNSFNQYIFYQSLKLFNSILSNETSKYLLQPKQNLLDFEFDNINPTLNYWLQINNNNSLNYINELILILTKKLNNSTIEKYLQSNLDSIIKLLTINNFTIQKTSYQLLLTYFKSSSTQFIKSITIQDQEKFLILNDQFEKLLSFSNLNLKSNNSLDYNNILGKLMAWDLLLKYYSIQESGKTIVNGYLGDGYKVTAFLNEIFYLINRDKMVFRDLNSFPEIEQANTDAIQQVSGYLMYCLVKYFPSMVRRWFDECPRQLLQKADQFITSKISPFIIQSEIQIVNSHKEAPDSEFSVKGSSSTKEVIANYVKDEMTISLTLSIPDTYPLRVLTVDISKRVGVSESQWRQWLLSMTSLLLTQDGSILDVVLLWKNSLDKHFQGVEVCPICYSLFHNGNTPNYQCKTCKHKFHSACIFKWFNTSFKNTCPLCQSNLT